MPLLFKIPKFRTSAGHQELRPRDGNPGVRALTHGATPATQWSMRRGSCHGEGAQTEGDREFEEDRGTAVGDLVNTAGRRVQRDTFEKERQSSSQGAFG